MLIINKCVTNTHRVTNYYFEIKMLFLFKSNLKNNAEIVIKLHTHINTHIFNLKI